MAKVQNRFAELLAAKARKEKRGRISRREVVDETGISLSSVQNWATNSLTRFDSHQIAVFCNYFDCTVDELLVIVGDDEGQNETAPAVA